MKKATILFAVTMLIASVSFAQTVSQFPWTEGFESGNAPVGFTFIDNDGDGNNWDYTYLYGPENNAGHNGSLGMIGSASWDPNTQAALTPDNWMILPAFAIPTNATDLSLSWYEKGQDANYPDEYYSVYITTAGRTVADFTATTAVLNSTVTGNWVKKTVDLSAYAGQTINIAFRHYNCTDMFYLDIDDIRVGGPEAPELIISGPQIILLSEEAIFTATSTVSTLAWYVDGTEQAETGLTLAYTFTVEGSHAVVAKATNAVGNIYDTLTVNVIDCSDPISSVPYNEGFDAPIPCWHFVSADPVNDDRTGINSEVEHSGLSAFVFSSYSTASDYNQFLITPEISLPIEGNYMVSFWYMGNTAQDAFRVKVSTTTSDTAAFTTVLGDYSTVATEWTQVAFQLPAGTKYIAINYYGDYAYYLYVDDFQIDQMGAPFVSISGPTTIGTGMDATFSADVNLADNVAWYIDGAAVSTTGNELTTTFTTAGDHTVRVEATNNFGTASDSIVVDVFSCDGFTAPYTADFSSSLGCWATRSDADQGYGWFASVDMFETDPIGQVLSMSADSFFGMMFDAEVDNWLISPWIAMPTEGRYDIAFKVRPYTSQYASDHYAVYVIDQAGNETKLHEETLGGNNTNFSQRVVSIPESITGQFRIAFRHFNSTGGYVIILDEIKVVVYGSLQGIDDVNTTNISVYPNPANDVLNIRGENISEVELIDVNGRIVINERNAESLNIGSLPAGVYMVRVVTAEGIFTQKVVKH